MQNAKNLELKKQENLGNETFILNQLSKTWNQTMILIQ